MLLGISFILTCTVSMGIPPEPSIILPSQGNLAPDSNEAPLQTATSCNIGVNSSSTGIVKVLVVLIEFQDIRHDPVHGRGYFYDLLFSPNNPRSLYNYFYEASYGQLVLTGEIIEWVLSKKSMSYYGKDKGKNIDSANCKRFELVREALSLIKRSGIDFPVYDQNCDGYLDHLIVIHSGVGQESKLSKSTDAIWSHHGRIIPPDVLGSIRVSHYCLLSECSPLGVIAHEFGHDLGLPDLYDSSLKSNGVGIWDVMGYGAWLMGGHYPSLPSAWSKMQLGWLKPRLVEQDHLDLSIMDSFNNLEPGDVIMVPINSNEYFLIENRQRIGFDMYLPGEGILVWHIDESVGNIINNNINADPKHRRVDLEEADGRDDLDRKLNYGDSTDAFYAGNSSMFTRFTYPSSLSYNGQRSISVTNISSPGALMTFDLTFDDDLHSHLVRKEAHKTAELGQNYPNPFNPETWIPFRLYQEANVKIFIYNQSGQLIRAIDLGRKRAGDYTSQQDAVYWDGKNELGEVVGSGVFFYGLLVNKHFYCRKMIMRK